MFVFDLGSFPDEIQSMVQCGARKKIRERCEVALAAVSACREANLVLSHLSVGRGAHGFVFRLRQCDHPNVSHPEHQAGMRMLNHGPGNVDIRAACCRQVINS